MYFSLSGVVCAWINIDPEPSIDPPEFQPIASFFGIWHEHRSVSTWYSAVAPVALVTVYSFMNDSHSAYAHTQLNSFLKDA